MKLIAENIHVISKITKEAFLNRDEEYIKNLMAKIIKTKPSWVDFNVGPSKGKFEGTIEWLVDILKKMSEIPISFDSTNINEIENGLKLVKDTQKCIINSTNADDERLEKFSSVAAKYNTYLIALTLSSQTGIPKEAEERLDLAFKIIDVCESKGIGHNKIIFDPLVLPIGIDQSQAKVSLDTIRMLKESFDPPVLTTIGLSNISNGTSKHLRSIINTVYMVMAMGAGLDSAIVDVFDEELLRVHKMIVENKPQKSYDKLYLNIFETFKNYGEIEDISYDKKDKEQEKIMKTAKILMNKEIYSACYI